MNEFATFRRVEVPKNPPNETLRDTFVSHREMYQLPHDQPLNEKDLSRYLESRKAFEDLDRKEAARRELSRHLFRDALNGAFALVYQTGVAAEDDRVAIAELVEEAIGKGDAVGFSLANSLPGAQRYEHFSRVLQSNNLRLHRVVAMSVQDLAIHERSALHKELNDRIDQILQNFPPPSEFEDFFGIIPYLSEATRQRAVTYMRDFVAYELNRPNFFLTARDLIRRFPMPERGELEEALKLSEMPKIFETADNDSFGREHDQIVVDAQLLYKNAPETFFRAQFAKKGSETILLGKALRGKAILRTIDALAYLGWRKAYEAPDFWKEAGFSYVPVEPIVSVQENTAPGSVDVFARVLPGPNAYTWLYETSGQHREHILRQIEAITENLEKLGVVFAQISESHLHLRNFVLVFDRDHENNPILERPPQVYLIDFDQSAPLLLPEKKTAE